MATTIHPTAIVDAGAVLGEDCRVWHFVHISAGARIGGRCSFGQNVFVGNDVTIGDNARVQNNVSIYDAVTLEDDVFCGMGSHCVTAIANDPVFGGGARSGCRRLGDAERLHRHTRRRRNVIVGIRRREVV